MTGRARTWLSAGALLGLALGTVALCSHRLPPQERQLATVRKEAGLGLPVALISP